MATALGSIEAQSYPNIETLIVDSNSTDQAMELTESFGSNSSLMKGGSLGQSMKASSTLKTASFFSPSQIRFQSLKR